MTQKISKSKKIKQSFWHHHRVFLVFLISFLLVILGLVLVALYGQYQANQYQASLNPFYNTSNLSLNGPVGQVVRSEPLGQTVPGGTAMRIIYRTQKADGSPTFSSGIVFTPTAQSNGPRQVIAWAHG
ncbi:hypothetical protein H0W80_04440, partial [Candidatus Saccharibacteria bacterium]|nr:hypothetical protein [Candidatus Saccharibacteria bacterium]